METYLCNGICHWKGSRGPKSLFGMFYFVAEALFYRLKLEWRIYSAISRPSVHNYIRRDNVLFFTAINTKAPVGLLLCIVCLDLPGKQAVEETAILLTQKYCSDSKKWHRRFSEGSFSLISRNMQIPGSWEVSYVSVQWQIWTSLYQ